VKEPTKLGFNPYQQALLQQAAKTQFDREVSRSLLSLHKQGKVPPWVLRIIDIEVIKLAAK
jgi:hypothetical protein